MRGGGNEGGLGGRKEGGREGLGREERQIEVRGVREYAALARPPRTLN